MARKHLVFSHVSQKPIISRLCSRIKSFISKTLVASDLIFKKNTSSYCYLPPGRFSSLNKQMFITTKITFHSGSNIIAITLVKKQGESIINCQTISFLHYVFSLEQSGTETVGLNQTCCSEVVLITTVTLVEGLQPYMIIKKTHTGFCF